MLQVREGGIHEFWRAMPHFDAFLSDVICYPCLHPHFTSPIPVLFVSSLSQIDLRGGPKAPPLLHHRGRRDCCTLWAHPGGLGQVQHLGEIWHCVVESIQCRAWSQATPASRWFILPPPTHTYPILQRDDILQCIKEYADISVWTVQNGADGNPVVYLPEDAMLA